MDPTASPNNLPVLVTQACFSGANIIAFDNAIMHVQNENMKNFLRHVIAELGIFWFFCNKIIFSSSILVKLLEHDPHVEHQFMLEYSKLLSKIITMQLF
jgi:hypothetical protein